MSQLTFARVLDEAAEADERRRRVVLDQHRQRVQAWFDELTVVDKEQLAQWFATFEFETCVALAAAAGDYRLSYVVHRK
jgi:hypothetical protein